MSISDSKVSEVMEFFFDNGEDATCEAYGISHESFARYRRTYKQLNKEQYATKSIMKQIADRFDEHELEAIAQGGRIVPGYDNVPLVDFSGDTLRFGYMTDTHIGSKYFVESLYDKALEEMDKKGCEFIAHSGDVTEGMSGREGHIYELTHLGYSEQRDYAVEMMNKWNKKWYAIDGNHDRWYAKKNGALIVKDICGRAKDAEFLGHDEGDISINGNTVIKLWHGEDGSSYAHSHRVQKVIESLTGGEKPNVLLLGHVHKAGYFFERNVHAISGGAISKQSKWMRGKRLPNHTGFWIVELVLNGKGVAACTPTFHPFYQ